MSLKKINQLFNFEKGVLQSSKCIEGEYDFITAATDWKTHNEYSHDSEALIFAAAASGSLGRTHYVKGKFISSDLCFILTPKEPEKLPVDLKFYHIIFNLYKSVKMLYKYLTISILFVFIWESWKTDRHQKSPCMLQ